MIKSKTKLLDVLENNLWKFGVTKNLDPVGAGSIGTAINQDVVEITCSFKPRRKHRPLDFRFFVGTKADVVLWQTPLFGKLYRVGNASILLPTFEDFISVSRNYLRHPSMNISVAELTLIEGRFRALHAKAILPSGTTHALSSGVSTPDTGLESDLDLV